MTARLKYLLIAMTFSVGLWMLTIAGTFLVWRAIQLVFAAVP
ncbi:hypothetical protein [Rhizobium tubonense]|nr:hypothetical protein [Rhizobium tubonense]